MIGNVKYANKYSSGKCRSKKVKSASIAYLLVNKSACYWTKSKSKCLRHGVVALITHLVFLFEFSCNYGRHADHSHTLAKTQNCPSSAGRQVEILVVQEIRGHSKNKRWKSWNYKSCSKNIFPAILSHVVPCPRARNQLGYREAGEHHAYLERGDCRMFLSYVGRQESSDVHEKKAAYKKTE